MRLLAQGMATMGRLDINPGKGLGPILLGMRPSEVLAAFAESQKFEDWMGGNLNDCLLFPGLRLHFTQCDARAPLPESILDMVVIHRRPDAYLFGLPITGWTKVDVLRELRSRAYEVQTPANGDVDVGQMLGLSFDEEGRLIWVELYHELPCPQ